jgi:hypothetical protein
VGLGLVYDMDSVILYASGFLLGDMDRDFDVDEEDIDDFVLGLKDAYAYHAAWGRPPSQSGNVNLDGDFGFDDIPPFLELLDAPAAQVPESTSLLLAWTGTLALVWVRRRLYPRR